MSHRRAGIGTVAAFEEQNALRLAAAGTARDSCSCITQRATGIALDEDDFDQNSNSLLFQLKKSNYRQLNSSTCTGTLRAA